jgi:casein kinase II subunit beta
MFVVNEILTRNALANRPHVDQNPSCSAWISEFTTRHDWLCVIDDAYVNDNFNLYGLSSQVEDYQNALKLVRGQYNDSPSSTLRKRAQQVYGLMHARYILTFQGARQIQPKYEQQLFGTCPRVACQNQPILPIGLDPNPGIASVKGFCPRCEDIYDVNSKLDGSYFGPYFAHFFLQAVKTDVKCERKEPTTLSMFGIPIEEDSRAFQRTRSVH